MKLEKISNNVLYAICGVSVLVFVLFFTVGYNNFDEKGNTAPQLTSVLLFLQYLLGVVTFVLMIWSVVKGIQNSGGGDEKATKGIPGSKIVLFTTILTILAFVVGYVFNLGEEPFTTSSGVTTSGGMVTVVDAFIWAIYIMFFVAVVTVILAATGVMTKSATKK
ncbi:MAG: hypothetical protein IJ197_03925 [Bacteroidaceae bacterium]|nr:hypothetical protein [Bacteroidaceae bacterium]